MARPKKQPTAPTDAGKVDSPPKRQSGGPGRLPKVSRDMVEAIVTFLDFGIRMVPPLAQDALEDYEKDALIDALLSSAKSNRFLANLIVRVTRVTSQGQLVTVGGAIVVRRLAIHGVASPMMGAGAEMLLRTMANTKLPTFEMPEPQPAPVTPIRTRPETAPEAEPAMQGASE